MITAFSNRQVFSIAAIPYGRGFLISCGMNLDGEREYKILVDVIERIARNGFDTLLPFLGPDT
jgi:hypothetical protein